ncbi:DEAD-box ATP-dependent RNA helicase chloroplastic isoform B [Micractinium conductrix]|uniref:Glutathione peroxidase n=1 Tax=Micractinium conductrix TaxID=554055 RepID=A0A2P6VEK3_9CHLO|nr:DEAD-box ATP-dependent RNA helicase chloroplastic isoform B [Micractinium conductrix]|eukprot:PSC72530.1 DEAD-box ATP-dependent RNA helicase chloroplastic isoform B [Micractinium conductrix]
MAASAALTAPAAAPVQHAAAAGWLRSAGGGSAPRRDAAAAAGKRRPSNPGRSSAGGGGRGRFASKGDSTRDRAALKELSTAVSGPEGSSRRGGGAGGAGGFGAARGGRRGRRGDDRALEAADLEGEADWDEELLADLSDSEVAELIGEEAGGDSAAVLAAFPPEVQAAAGQVLGQFSFSLDPFQVQAVGHLLGGKSVVVCAPTGAGKTAIAEAAALHFLAGGKRVIYTTPLKALSNQKLGEMRQRFGHEGAGLQTGDASLNVDAPVVVMTTEILRNQLYRVDEEEGKRSRDKLQDVGLVVLDEVHYLGDPSRGSVWEEVIINLPPHIQLLCMSATVRNPDDLGGWISQVHGECETIRTSFRPVPLTWHFCHSGTPAGGGAPPPARLLPLLENGGRRINPALLPPAKRYSGDDNSKTEWGRWDGLKKANMRLRTVEELVGSVVDDDWHNQPRWKRIPSLEAVALALHERAMLPAIWFIFSRRECDLAARHLDMHVVSLTSAEERQIIQAELDVLAAEQPEAVKGPFVGALLRGVASHHAGCLPAWKALVERLFQRGLLKLVFATETLAAGINMPARTTLIAALSRRRDGGIGALHHNELLQMAGRAGRRGYDTVGNCVIMQSKWEDADVAWDIIRRGPEPLRSQFTTGYSMVLNLLYTRSLEEARAFLDRSFSRYMGGMGAQRRLKEIEQLEAKAAGILDEVARRAGLSEQAEDLWARYQKLLGRLKEEKRAAKLLRAQLAEERAASAELALERLSLPRLVGLDLSASNLGDRDYRLPALLLCDLERGATGVWVVEPGPDYLCLGADNKLYQVGARHISAIAEGPHPIADDPEACGEALRFAQSLRSRSWVELSGDVGMAEGSVVTALIASKLLLPAELAPIVPSAAGLAALEQQRQRVRSVKAQVNEIKADRAFMRAARAFNKQATKAAALLERAQMLRAEVEQQEDSSWRAFEELLGVLREAGALEDSPQALPAAALAAAQQRQQQQQQQPEQQQQQEEQQQQAEQEQEQHADSTGGESSSSDCGGSGGTWLGFTPLGQVAREINCANELWMALVLTHEAVQGLEAPQLAAVLCSVIASESVSRPTVWTAYPASERVAATVLALEETRLALSALQIRHSVQSPIAVDLRLAGLVEAWASGCSWEEVMQDCSLDDGDVARLLTRTADMARQVAYCDTLLPPLRRAARQAMAAMDRKPISDLPHLHLDDKQQASGSLRLTTNHGNCAYSVRITDAAVKDGDALKGLRLGMKLDDGSLEALYEPANGHHLFRVQRTVQVRDKDIAVKITDIAREERATYINCTMSVDDNNSAKVIYKCNPGSKLDHKNAILGWVYRKDDIELEPRFNLATESLSAGVTWKVDDDNKLRAVFDMGSNEGALTWTNSGSLGGGGDTKVTARMKLDKDSMQQMPTLLSAVRRSSSETLLQPNMAVLRTGAAAAAALVLLVLALPLHASGDEGSGAPAPDTFYTAGLSAPNIAGSEVQMSSLAGKVTLVVNVASYCGYTDANYRGLQEVWDKYHEYGLEVLAFPCNQFGAQEPGSAEDIQAFLKEKYTPQFTLMSKVEMNGGGQHPVFAWLKSRAPATPGKQQGADIAWNFEKFLVSKSGAVVKRFGSDFTLHEVEKAVYDELVRTEERSEL